MNDWDRRPCVEVLGLLEADSRAIRRARRRRALWRAPWGVFRTTAVFAVHLAVQPFQIAAAVLAWLVSLPSKRRPATGRGGAKLRAGNRVWR